MAKDIQINSSLLDEPDFKFTKQSLIYASQDDGKERFRVKTLHYINDTADNDDDVFFYNMMKYIRFLKPDNETTAFTDKYRLIHMNCPGIFGENMKYWDFIYDHECLHQLWDTFAVGDKITEKEGSCDHYVLNIASDCVINDYLSRIRKKSIPDGLITPEYLHKAFNVDYDPKNDTQYTLYMKLIQVKEKLKKDDLCQKNAEDFDGKKLKPGSINQGQSGGGPQPPDPPQGKHSDDYIKGWTDSIKDVLNKKMDPTKFTPRKVNSDYDQGYNDAAEQMKKGIEDGISISKDGGGGGGSKGSDLPDIPWDLPQDQQQQQQGGQSGQGEGDDSKKDSSDSSSSSSSSSGGASDEEIDKMTADEAAEAAAESAKEAEEAAKKARAKANKSGDKSDEAAAQEAEAAAENAKNAAEEAADAAADGNKKKAQKEAKNARDAAKDAKDAAGEEEGGDSSSDSKSGNSQPNQGPPQAGTGEGIHYFENMDDLKRIAKEAEETVKKEAGRVSGAIGEFCERCRKSFETNKSGLGVYTHKGLASWNIQLTHAANAYIKKRVFQKKREWKKTYQRFSRRAGYVDYGAPITPGKKVKDNKLPIITAMYVDVSGSMSGCIDQVWKACYKICEQLKKTYSKEKVVDEVSFKMFAFDTRLKKLDYGKKANAEGGTMSFGELLNHIKKESPDCLVNVIITDAGFGSEVSASKVEEVLNSIEGMLIFITNTAEDRIKEIANKNQTKMAYIQADSNFNIDNE